jgi:hypothetical protein
LAKAGGRFNRKAFFCFKYANKFDGQKNAVVSWWCQEASICLFLRRQGWRETGVGQMAKRRLFRKLETWQ